MTMKNVKNFEDGSYAVWKEGRIIAWFPSEKLMVEFCKMLQGKSKKDRDELLEEDVNDA